MSKIVPINSIVNNLATSSNVSIEYNSNKNKPIPILNENNLHLEIDTNLNTSSSIQFNNGKLTPIIDEDEIYLEMNGIGPIGPPGLTGNGIDRIEKTSTSGIIDTYTIFFTDGRQFNYQITNGVVYYYDGEYEITPMVNTAQILPTANFVMREDVNVQEIPYQEVSNPKGGQTAIIGGI